MRAGLTCCIEICLKQILCSASNQCYSFSTLMLTEGSSLDEMPKPQSIGRFMTPELVVQETGNYILEQQAFLDIVRTAEYLQSTFSDLLAEHGLTFKQYNVLRAIRRGEPEGVKVSQIGAQMADRQADVTRLVDRLVREELVSRHTDPEDRRAVRATLTAKGAALLKQLDEPVISKHREQLGHLADTEIEILITLIKKARGESAR